MSSVKTQDAVFSGMLDHIKAAAQSLEDDSQRLISYSLRGLKIPPFHIAMQRMRENLGMTQEQFAKTYGLTHLQVQIWERPEAQPPDDTMRMWLCMILADPEGCKAMAQT